MRNGFLMILLVGEFAETCNPFFHLFFQFCPKIYLGFVMLKNVIFELNLGLIDVELCYLEVYFLAIFFLLLPLEFSRLFHSQFVNLCSLWFWQNIIVFSFNFSHKYENFDEIKNPILHVF